MRRAFTGVTALLGAILLATSSAAQLVDTFNNWIEHPAIAYRSRPTADPVAALSRELREGRLQLRADGRSGYLRSILDALRIPVESQVLVFNPDSLQQQRISALNPRAIFFNDAVSVAWVRGGFIELASQDPQQGIVFYVLDDEIPGKPVFTRRQDCLSCHYAPSTVGVPGMVDESYGQLRLSHETPLEQRWGGWYVTGEPNALHHLGNRVTLRTAGATPASASAASDWRSLDGKFDTAGYLSTRSDIVALLAFNHQMRGMNLLGRIGWEARVAEFERTQGESAGFASPRGRVDRPVPLDAAARELVDYFLFVDEAPFAVPVRGTSGFTERFEVAGPRDRAGRSLRQLDLKTRLLRYPCSYLIYTEAFDALPPDAKDAIYRRMWRVLSGEEKDSRYQRLAAGDRRAIIDILRDTKADLPAYFE